MALRTTGGGRGGRAGGGDHDAPLRGRGATLNLEGRFEDLYRETEDDGWTRDDEPPAPVPTQVLPEAAKSIIARNDSPDVGFDQSINPYRGCEHGCIYCYARPAHAYVGLSPGIDFETRIFAKKNAAALLRRELAAPGYACRNIQIGGNTDPYQQAERELRITRSVIEVLHEHDHPFSIITKNALIERDIDLLAPMARKGLVRAYVSVTNWDAELARKLEPRASAPWRRIEAIRRLSAAGIPTGVMVAPIIPVITDQYMEEVLERAKEAGAIGAGYVLLRLPHEIEPLWEAWLEAHYPLKAKHVMSLVRQMRGGRAYDSRWGVRQRGTGAYADLIEKRFALACERLDLNGPRPALDTAQFRKPAPPAAPARPATSRKPADDAQLDLF